MEAKEVLAVGGSFILSEKMLQEDEASARQHVQSLLTKIKERQAKIKKDGLSFCYLVLFFSVQMLLTLFLVFIL